MFDRIRKAFSRGAKESGEPAASNSHLLHGPVSEWAATNGFGFAVDRTGQGVSLEGDVSGRPWRLQLGSPSRQYIRGEEVRARAVLGLDDDLAVVVMSRPLKDALERQAYEIYTDNLQTSIDPRLPEEMRWIAIYEEVGWDGLPGEFWDRYAVMSDRRESAMAWIRPSLARQMLDWAEPGPAAEVPFVMLLLRGKAYLRMEYSPPDLATLQQAALIFTSACESALGALAHERS
jgi:hypothetical protein